MKNDNDFEAIIPLTDTARKYGYVTWHKRDDDQVRTVIGSREYVDLVIEDIVQRKKRIDWDKRRIGITYTLTRTLPQKISRIRLKQIANGKINIKFE